MIRSSSFAVNRTLFATTSSATAITSLRRCSSEPSEKHAQTSPPPPPPPEPKKQFSWKLPPGIEVYSACVFVTLGYWYWLEAHYRRVDRHCDALRNSGAEQTKQLTEVVASAQSRWHTDVRQKESMMLKVQQENARLAKYLDEVTHFLKKCNVPVS